MVITVFTSLTMKEVGWIGRSPYLELKVEVSEEIWVKGVHEYVCRLPTQFDWEYLYCALLHVAPELMIYEGNVLHSGAHLGRRGECDGPADVLVDTRRIKYGSKDLGMFQFEPQEVSFLLEYTVG